MTRNSKGEIIPQCEATYIREQNHVHCVKDLGHDGRHSDVRGDWGFQQENLDLESAESVTESTDPAS